MQNMGTASGPVLSYFTKDCMFHKIESIESIDKTNAKVIHYDFNNIRHSFNFH